MSILLKPRVCEKCGKGKGTTAFRHMKDGQWTRGYFHPKCFNAQQKAYRPKLGEKS